MKYSVLLEISIRQKTTRNKVTMTKICVLFLLFAIFIGINSKFHPSVNYPFFRPFKDIRTSITNPVEVLEAALRVKIMRMLRNECTPQSITKNGYIQYKCVRKGNKMVASQSHNIQGKQSHTRQKFAIKLN